MQIKRLLELAPDAVQCYWQTLYMHDRLKYRLCNITSPTWSDVLNIIVKQGNNMFMVEDEGKLVAEFLLENFGGHAAQIHFSMHPENKTRYSYEVAEYALNQMLSWSKLQTIFGSTPILNRVACMFVLNVGFKKLCVMPKAVNYLGVISDTMISVRTR